MKPGIYAGIPNSTYHSGPGASKSTLDLVSISPAHLQARRLTSNENHQPTAAQALGTAFHALLLEPQEFARTYCLPLRMQDVPGGAIEDREVLVRMVQELNATRLPKLSTSGSKAQLVERIVDELHGGDGEAATDLQGQPLAELKDILVRANESRPGLLSTTGNRHELADLLRAHGRQVTLWSDAKAEWERNNSDRIALPAETWDQLHRMRDAVMAHPAAHALLTRRKGEAELSAYWVDEATGVLCRCRPDFLRDDDIVVDLKTTTDASPEGFARSIAKWRYDVQDPFYMDGLEQALGRPMKAFIFLAVETNAAVVDGVAMGVAVYRLDDESRELGRLKYRRDLQLYADCERVGRWPGYSHKLETISVPQWSLKQSQHLLEAA